MMRAMRALLVLLVLSAGSCGGGPSSSDCGPEVYEMEQMLKKMDRGLDWLSVDGIKLAPREDLPKRFVARSAVLHVRPGGIELDGQRMPVEEVASRVESMRWAYSGRNSRADRVVLAIDAATPWVQVVAATRAVYDGGVRGVVFVFGGSPGAPPPPRTRIDDDLDKVMAGDPSSRAVEMARMVEKLSASCTGLQKLWKRLAVSPADVKETTLVDQIGPAILECQCKTDVGAMRSLLYRMMKSPPVTIQEVTLDTTARRIEQGPTVPWGQANRVLPKGNETVWLDIPLPELPAVPDDAGVPDAGSSTAPAP